ncbi:MAG: 4Fe-4S binding protein [Spirochaetes bacterium]|nr:4Fe-4S binding protein [Spirochaetota bacterium]
MSDNIAAFEELQDILDSHPSSAPKSETFLEILHKLFTLEEARVALAMSFKAKGVDEIAEKAGISSGKASELLESMANKVIIFSKKKEGSMLYGLLPAIPGLFEFPFMKGGGTPELDKLGELWEKYHAEALGNGFSGNPTPLVRVVPVSESISAQSTVHPYEEVLHFIEAAEFIALTNCACRVSVGKCDKPKDVCLIFDGSAKFLVDRGYAKEATKEEAMDALRRSERAGLVHVSNNSKDRASLICNCCPCCCTVLRGKTQLKNFHAFGISRFEAIVSADECTGCQICVDDRCPVGAIEMQDSVAVVSGEKCIGCGLCITACPSEAISWKEREIIPEIPDTIYEMGIKAAQEKGKLDKFMKIMQK